MVLDWGMFVPTFNGQTENVVQSASVLRERENTNNEDEKNNMRKRITLFAMFCASVYCLHAQIPMQIEMTYDNAGNRTSIKVMEMPSNKKGGNNSKNAEQRDTAYYVDQLPSVTMKVYPNPTQGIVHIDMEGDASPKQHTICIYDSHGRKLHESQNEDASAQIDLSSYATGIYIVELSVNGEHTTWKIIKR